MKPRFTLVPLLLALLALAAPPALPQSSPGLVTGQIPTAAQWNSYFAAKQDLLSAVPLPISGGTLTGELSFAASTTANASFTVPSGVAPSSPSIGDVWATATGGLFWQGPNPTGAYSFRPYQTCDVRSKGALGNGSADDSASINACVAAVQANGVGGIVFFPPGNYCTFTGISITTAPPVILMGAGRTASILNSCAHDVTTLTLGSGNMEVRTMQVFGPNLIGTTHDALVLTAGCVQCKLDRVLLQAARHGLNVAGQDGMFTDIEVTFGYGTSNFYATGNFWGFRAKVDQGFVTLPPPGTVFAAWQANHVYAANAVVTLNGFYIQTVAGGTSGGSSPTLLPYGSSIVDNTVTWILIAPTTFYAVNLDSGVAVATLDNYDMSGAYTHGLYLSNSLATTGPQSVQVTKSFTASIGDTITQDATAFNNTIAHTQMGACNNTGCAGITINGGTVTLLEGNSYNNAVGVNLLGGTETLITGGNFFQNATTAAVNVAAGVSGFIVTGNNLGGSALATPNAIGVNVAAGASDHYVIQGNDCRLATTCVTDAGTGIHKIVEPASWVTFTPTITCGTGTVSTYTTQAGRYRLMGSTAFLNAVIKVNNAGTCTGTITLAGLPFTTQTITAQTIAGADNTSNAVLSTNVPANGTTVQLFTSAGGNPTATDQFTVTGSLETSTPVP